MKTVSLAEAKARLSQLIAEASEGETVQITRRGKPIAQITAVDTPRAPVDAAALGAFTDTLPFQDESAGTFMRRLRDDERY